jgi:hypothetical protein
MDGCPFAENDVAVDDREVKTRAALDIVFDGEVTEEAASDRRCKVADGALLTSRKAVRRCGLVEVQASQCVDAEWALAAPPQAGRHATRATTTKPRGRREVATSPSRWSGRAAKECDRWAAGLSHCSFHRQISPFDNHRDGSSTFPLNNRCKACATLREKPKGENAYPFLCVSETLEKHRFPYRWVCEASCSANFKIRTGIST